MVPMPKGVAETQPGHSGDLGLHIQGTEFRVWGLGSNKELM